MAFKIWQIGLHLQQQEAVAVAIVRGAKECFLQRWWRLPLENDIIKDGRIVDAQQLAVGITLILRLTGSAEARIDAVLLQAEQQLARSLQITKPRLLEQQQLREQRSQRQRQRQFTRDWQSALEALAALLPEHAWLTTISWQQGTLEIKGLTTSITALNALETSLRQDASFHLNQRGATQQDAQGRWQFEYQLTRKVSDEHIL